MVAVREAVERSVRMGNEPVRTAEGIASKDFSENSPIGGDLASSNYSLLIRQNLGPI